MYALRIILGEVVFFHLFETNLCSCWKGQNVEALLCVYLFYDVKSEVYCASV